MRTKNKHTILPVFVFGAFVYGTLEIIWRGFTHPSMLLLGGFCLTFIYNAEKKLYGRIHIGIRAFFYAFVITLSEFICGLALNIGLGLNIWDYTPLPFDILGQICPHFFLVWLMLSYVCCFVCKAMRFAFV